MPNISSNCFRRGEREASTSVGSTMGPLEHQRYRTIVGNLDGHFGAKAPRRHREPPTSELGAEAFIEGNGLLWSGGFDERGAPAADGVAVERELRDDQQLAANLAQSQVHFSGGVG